MSKYKCRYNKKHKFDSEEAQLEHESRCPDKKKRTDSKECPFSNIHIIPIKLYENHIKRCKFQPKTVKKEEPKNDNDNSNNQNSLGITNKNDNNKKNEVNNSEFWGDELDTNENRNDDSNKIVVFNLMEKITMTMYLKRKILFLSSAIYNPKNYITEFLLFY